MSLAVLFLLQCGKKEEAIEKQILIARVGDKTIAADEFIRRAEFTVRPAYCSRDSYIHKKIVLNSLIAEKLFALEAGDGGELMRNEDVQLYLQGRKEQAMRQLLYYKEAYEPVKLDSSEVRNVYQVAGRVYQVAYFSLNDPAMAERARREMQEQGRSFEEAFRLAGSLGEMPRREVAYDAPESRVIHDALFRTELKKGQIIGPLRDDEGNHTFMKVEGWTDRLAVSEVQMQQRWQDVSQRLTEQEAGDAYAEYVGGLMRGKRIDFDPSTFARLVNIVGPYYLKTSEEKRAMFNEQFWGKDEGDDTLARMGAQLDAILDAPLFRIDGQTWTVGDFEREMKIHPLVFRARRLTQKDFAEQFKLAIVDMVRDRYITKDAYEKGYDRAETVQQNVAMWRDNLLYLYHQNQHLKSIGKHAAFGRDYLKIIEADLNPLVDSLQKKYGNVIEINTAAFENLKLTGVDMVAMQRYAPFPIVVPNFPVVTTDHLLDYGRKME